MSRRSHPNSFVGPLVLATALSLAFAGSGGAQSLQSIDIHGFGTWAYARTNSDNDFLTGTHAGNYGGGRLDVNIGATITDRFRLRIQPFWEYTGLEDETENGLAYAFAEYSLLPTLQFRVGSVKQPFGIYTEIYDVGTLRPFLDLPQSLYGGSGFAGQAYRGAGLSGTHEFRHGWGLNYDLYGGAMFIEEAATAFDYAMMMQLPASDESHIEMHEAVGTRLVLRTPVNGLSFGGSAYRGSVTDGAAQAPRWVGAAQLEYLSSAVSLRSEYAHEHSLEMGEWMRTNSVYGELGYRLTEHWQGALRAERLDSDMPGVMPSMKSWLQHREVAVGLNYWLTDSFVLKSSFHDIDGNRFAVPTLERLGEMLANHERPNVRTHFITIGAQADF